MTAAEYARITGFSYTRARLVLEKMVVQGDARRIVVKRVVGSGYWKAPHWTVDYLLR